MTSCPSFGHEKNFQVGHYFPANFVCRVMKGWLFKVPGPVSDFFAYVHYPLKVWMPDVNWSFLNAQQLQTSNMLFVFNSLLKSCDNNKKIWFSNDHVTDDIITLGVTWEDILWQMLSPCGLTLFYVKIVKVIMLFKKLPQRILG